MERLFYFLFSILFGVIAVHPQAPRTPLDDYFDTAGTIFIGKCSSVGPVNILMRASIALDVSMVIKGDPKLSKVTLNSEVPMKVGGLYLVRTDAKLTQAVPSGGIVRRDSVVPVLDGDELEKLRDLPAKTVILRTINIRIDQLESEIRQRQYELDALRAVKKDN